MTAELKRFYRRDSVLITIGGTLRRRAPQTNKNYSLRPLRLCVSAFFCRRDAETQGAARKSKLFAAFLCIFVPLLFFTAVRNLLDSRLGE